MCGKRTPKASVLAAKMNFKKMARLKLKVKGGEKMNYSRTSGSAEQAINGSNSQFAKWF